VRVSGADAIECNLADAQRLSILSLSVAAWESHTPNAVCRTNSRLNIRRDEDAKGGAADREGQDRRGGAHRIDGTSHSFIARAIADQHTRAHGATAAQPEKEATATAKPGLAFMRSDGITV